MTKLCTLEVPDSNLGTNSGYPDSVTLWFSSVPQFRPRPYPPASCSIQYSVIILNIYFLGEIAGCSMRDRKREEDIGEELEITDL
jgi:hypothetical protein